MLRTMHTKQFCLGLNRHDGSLFGDDYNRFEFFFFCFFIRNLFRPIVASGFFVCAIKYRIQFKIGDYALTITLNRCPQARKMVSFDRINAINHLFSLAGSWFFFSIQTDFIEFLFLIVSNFKFVVFLIFCIKFKMHQKYTLQFNKLQTLVVENKLKSTLMRRMANSYNSIELTTHQTSNKQFSIKF